MTKRYDYKDEEKIRENLDKYVPKSVDRPLTEEERLAIAKSMAEDDVEGRVDTDVDADVRKGAVDELNDEIGRMAREQRDSHSDQGHVDMSQDEPKKFKSLEEQNPFLPNFNTPTEEPGDPLQPPIENPFIPGFQNKTEEPPIENPFIPRIDSASWPENDPRYACQKTDKGRVCVRKDGK
jgi:hypothetical protein